MSNIITREDILREKLKDIKSGEYLLELFKVAEEVGIGDEIKLQNNFTTAVLEAIGEELNKRGVIDLDALYKCIRNVYYVVELYLKGFYNNEHYMSLEEFLTFVKEKKVIQVIMDAGKVFETRINKVRKKISKSKKKIPWENRNYRETKNLLEQIDSDTRYCLNYPTTPANLSDFYFGTYHEFAKPVTVSNLNGIIALEETVHALYQELRIISKIDVRCIDKLCREYARNVGVGVYFNLFERVINNYLFAIPYSDTPEKLEISGIDAKLIINEIKMGSLNSNELINTFISKYEFDENEVAYLEKYGKYLQARLNSLKEANYFGELFVITKPK